MSELGYAKSFKDLIVYQKARELALTIYCITQSFPKEEMYSLTDQIRRSSRAIGAQIAEAWAKRRYERHFISKLSDSDGEPLETQHWVESARDCKLLNTDKADRLSAHLQEIGRMLNSMMIKAHLFCQEYSRLIREEFNPYEYNTH